MNITSIFTRWHVSIGESGWLVHKSISKFLDNYQIDNGAINLKYDILFVTHTTLPLKYFGLHSKSYL